MMSKRELFEFLYSYSPIDHATKDGNGISLTISISGDNESGFQALRSVFHLCQYAYIREGKILFVTLNINLFSDDEADLKQLIKNGMPSLETYPDYANVNVYPKNKCEETDCDYLIECNGDKIVITTSDGSQYAEPDPASVEELDIVNINQKYVNLLAKKNCVSFSEAIAKRNEQEKKDPYSFESSFACSAHMPARLILFGTDKEQAKVKLEELLVKTYDEKRQDIIYKALIILEHRRWNAYVISDGFITPSIEMFNENAYTVWRDHKNTSMKLHPCLCDMGQDPFYLYDRPKLWNDKNFENDPDLSDLDKLSVRTYQLCKRLAAERREAVLIMISSLESQSSLFEGFCAVARRIVLDEDYKENYLLKICKNDAVSVDNGRFSKEIEAIEKELEVFRVRNIKKDFVLLDVNVINALSFDLWHGLKFRNAIIACSGDCVKDVTIPFLLSCHETYFIIDESLKDKEDHKNKIARFYKLRSLNEPHFYETDMLDSHRFSELTKELIDNIRKRFDKNVVLACTDNMPGCSAYVFGSVALGDDGIKLFGQKNSDVIDLETGNVISCGVKRSIAAVEYLELSASECENAYEVQTTFQEYYELEKIFVEHSKLLYDEEDRVSCVWSSISQCFNKACKAYDLKEQDLRNYFGDSIYSKAVKKDESDNGIKEGKLKNVVFDPLVYNKLGIGILLNALANNHIIGEVTGDPSNGGITVQAPDLKVRIALLCISMMTADDLVEEKEVSYQRCSAQKEAILLKDNKGRECRLLSATDYEPVRRGKVQIIKDMLKDGIIKNIDKPELFGDDVDINSLPKDLDISFDFASVNLKQLFQVPGKLFEQILYRRVQELDMFADIYNGVMLAWDANHDWDIMTRMNEYFETNEGVGKSYYLRAREWSKSNAVSTTENEIDIVMMNNLDPIFISCKTGTAIKNEWLYEIAAVSLNFKATPMLVVSFSLLDEHGTFDVYIKRAKGMGVSLIGSETIFDDEKFRTAMKQISSGEVYSVH